MARGAEAEAVAAGADVVGDFGEYGFLWGDRSGLDNAAAVYSIA